MKYSSPEREVQRDAFKQREVSANPGISKNSKTKGYGKLATSAQLECGVMDDVRDEVSVTAFTLSRFLSTTAKETMSATGSSTKIFNRTTEAEGAIFCYCPLHAPLKVSNSANNPGRFAKQHNQAK